MVKPKRKPDRDRTAIGPNPVRKLYFLEQRGNVFYLRTKARRVTQGYASGTGVFKRISKKALGRPRFSGEFGIRRPHQIEEAPTMVF